MAKTTNISFDKKKYYKVYYSNNKDYLRLKQRLRYYQFYSIPLGMNIL